jgi:hypothetical protein
MNDLQEMIEAFINNPEDVEINYKLGIYYHSIGQTASALSYYLRCAERSEDPLLQYECLLRGAMCFHSQGTRNLTVKGMIQHAIALQPKRPEAYYLLSRHHEKHDVDGHWMDSYMVASIGDSICDLNSPPLRTNIDYPGKFAVKFQKAVSSWWCGLCDESSKIFLDLYNNYQLDDNHKELVFNNLKMMNAIEPFPTYDQSKHIKLRHRFPSSVSIGKNNSESYQDMFVLSMLDGKKDGHYLEIGAGDPEYGNNTLLLEKEFGWNGIGLDLSEEFVAAHNRIRKNKCLLKDATNINYDNFLNGLGFPTTIDYLQIDCDPPEVSYNILLTIPFDTHKFAVITYEHDYYCDETKSFRDKSRKYLESYGYIRVVGNISPEGKNPYEDWWVHPNLINRIIFQKMLRESDDTIKAEDYMLGLS